MRCGLLGRKLSHSYSPQIHRLLGDYSYELFEVEPEDLRSFFKKNNFQGMNVTIPYKKDVIPFCDTLSAYAKKMGAVNTVVRSNDGKLNGYNTDCYGFLARIQKTGLSVSGKKVLVLGSGGASATAIAVLTELGAYPVVISRSGENNYTNLSRHADAAIIVNCTPVGMYPNVDDSPVDISLFPQLEGVLDMIYNPSSTRLLQQAEQRGIVHENGLWMLVAQAKRAAELFTGKEIDNQYISSIHAQMQRQMKNIILIGMPGCGKTTVGRMIAETTGKVFVDADAEIVRLAGMEIPEIFTKFGENHFRDLETQVLSQLGKKSGLVISTGGGCVTRDENYAHLHQNGTIVWIQRDLNNLTTEGRPLSASKGLTLLYQQRLDLYKFFSDISVDNNADLPTTVQNIITALEDKK